ncbi:MAG: hypothetical protein KKF85_12995 [Gammaproteobacteria bacterium]|nr:hypothetical protein [Rhodocyclaceae bacterium]MBU3909950.1 hypothetical protein [Gammaproteobacteria bacterium]MBU3987892.1 hypothetical protein [Gammaproteobacteria bacterium]MBU4003923.1 hypothetical protein [Gammaproteobacteria bacterium]MBU4020170.1 hypothetical protein [Gammaproteobacteria bacterium]
MRFIRDLPFPILIVITVLMLGAPFVPEPHLVEKARMAMNGTLTRPIDLFDVVWHLLPAALLAWKTVLWRRERAAVNDQSSADTTG